MPFPARRIYLHMPPAVLDVLSEVQHVASINQTPPLCYRNRGRYVSSNLGLKHSPSTHPSSACHTEQETYIPNDHYRPWRITRLDQTGTTFSTLLRIIRQHVFYPFLTTPKTEALHHLSTCSCGHLHGGCRSSTAGGNCQCCPQTWKNSKMVSLPLHCHFTFIANTIQVSTNYGCSCSGYDLHPTTILHPRDLASRTPDCHTQ